MDRPPLDVSPVASFLIGLAERRVTGRVELQQRSVSLVGGEVRDVSSARGDPDFGEFTLRSGRVSAPVLARAREQAMAGGLTIEEALISHTRLGWAEIRNLRRSLWLDRLIRSLRSSLGRDVRLPVLEPANTNATAAESGDTAKFLPLIMDALGRIALDADAGAVGARLNHRLIWLTLPLTAEAKHWAALGDTPERPVVSALLARLPACAPQLAALLRAGFARLQAPGRTPTRNLSRTETLPPPPPRLAMLVEPPPRPTPRPDSAKPPAPRAHGPRVQLDPGGAGVPIDAIPQVQPSLWPAPRAAERDPLRAIELSLANETSDKTVRARGFVELSRLWEERIGSLEESTRALREAVAADPDDPALMERAARHCFRLGQGELAVRYASAAVVASSDVSERARRYELLAHIERARGHMDECIQALSEAASEHPEEPSPHEGMAQILADRDQLLLAAAHARMAATYYAVRDPARALTLQALAYGWHPSDVQSAHDYADALQAHGHPEAAIAVSAETARNLSGLDRQSALDSAALRAEQHNRRDLCAELLLEIFDEDPSHVAIHTRLDANMDRAGLEAEHAAVLEVIARHTHGAGKPSVLVRVGETLARVEGEHDTSLRYLWLAWRLDDSALSSEQWARLQAVGPEQLSAWPTHADELVPELEARLAADGGDDVETWARLAALRAECGDARGVVSACLRLLSIVPEHAMAAARLWRAAAEISDAVLKREALTWLARMRTGREQGRALALLARQLENMADFDGALTSAEAALAQDSSAADAAVIALRHAHRLEPRRALLLLTQARALLAAPPVLLMSIAEAAAAANDRARQLQALDELSCSLPFLLQPRLRALAARLADDDAEAISVHATALLAHCAGPEVSELARVAVSRLAELGEPAAAARLAEQVMSCQGHNDPSYADHARQLAETSGEPALIATALERAASVHEGARRLDCLLQLAAQHAARADHVAEVRALLRALPLHDDQGRALELLAQRFAATSDKTRLLTVLTLRLDATSDPDARRMQLFDMASAARAFGNDRAAICEYMTALFQESASERSWLLFALGGLFALGDSDWATKTACEIAQGLAPDVSGVIYLWLAHKAELENGSSELALNLAAEGARRFSGVGELLLLVERLTLAARDKRRALALYGELLAAAIGPHGRRALHYRAGRWLERAGEPAEALVHYQRAFELSPGAGVAFYALERAARAARQLDVLIDAQQVLAGTVSDDHLRADLLEAAARSCLQDLDDPARALQILMDADRFVPPSRLDLQLNQAIAALAETDPSAARAVVARVIEAREARAEALWAGEPKAELLLSVARLHLRLNDDASAAIEPFTRVLNTELRTSLKNETLAAGLIDFSQALSAGQRAEDAAAALSEARLLAPDLVRARALHELPAQPRVETRPESAWVDEAAAKRAATEEQAVRARADLGDSDALAELVRIVGADDARQEEAGALLGQLVRTAPEHTEALRALHAQAQQRGAHAEARVCAQLLSLFEPSIERPRRIPFQPEDLGSDELAKIVHARQNPALGQLLSLAWEHAQTLPHLRFHARSLSLGERVPDLGSTPLTLAYARACQMLGCEAAPLFIKAGAFPEVRVVPTHPPSIVVRSGLKDSTALEFLIARSLVCAERQHALLCALPELDGRALLAALAGAFGRGQASHVTQLSRSEKGLASDLWQAIPTRTQSQMRALLERCPNELDYDSLRANAELCAVRAGLLVASDPACALETLARSDDALRDCNVHDENGFARACQISDEFREVIRTALSLPYIGLTAATLEHDTSDS